MFDPRLLCLLCVCGCVWFFVPRICHSYEDVTFAGEGLQILTYSRHSWPLSHERSLACHGSLWHGASVYNGHVRGPMTLAPIFERCAVELSLSVFTIKVSSNYDSNIQPSVHEANAQIDSTCDRCGQWHER